MPRPHVIGPTVSAALLLFGCGSATAGLSADRSTSAGPSAAVGEQPVEPGWRWESYAGVELQVPAEWAEGALSAGAWAWCAGGVLGPAGEARRGGVNRPGGPMPAIMCPSPRPASSYGQGVDLGSEFAPGREGLAGGWAVETVEVAGVRVSVTSDDPALSARVLGSARSVRDGTDAHGCPVSTPLLQPGSRPAPGQVPPAAAVDSVSACRYVLSRPGSSSRESPPGPPEPLLASTVLRGADAALVVAELSAAPVGTGPDEADYCGPGVTLGEELVVLHVRDGDLSQEVVLRYSGCTGNGTDDGTTARVLTSELLQPLLVGPLAPWSSYGGVTELLGR